MPSDAAGDEINLARVMQQKAVELANAAVFASSRASIELEKHLAARPGLFARLFRRGVWRAWSGEKAAREVSARRAMSHAVAAREARIAAERQTAVHTNALASVESEMAQVDAALARADNVLSEARTALGTHLADESFWLASHGQLQTSTPWLTPQVQRLRDICFARALELHRAFIDAAAKPVRNNLNALFGILMGGGVDNATQPLLPSLWSTLFLVVPVISTTFASVGRMLRPMPSESIGWLLVDEAGQALPQAAVGAIMRARRSLIVGDPLQIEPVVTLPLSLVDRIARRMSVDPMIWTAPKASAQTLADAASEYQSWLEQVDGAVRVGIPLLVHRRCAQPMFGISNAVAYAGKMVQAKAPQESRIRDVLGPAGWLHVAGVGSGKWCGAEGEAVVRILQQLVSEGLDDPDLFVITPFRIVAQQMRALLVASDPVRRIADRPWHWARDRVGTVHTFQGREAEAVFLVLGAPEATQIGARNWAGHPRLTWLMSRSAARKRRSMSSAIANSGAITVASGS